MRRLSILVALSGLTLGASGCSWQAYAVARGLRHVTGVQTRFHALTPMASSLRGYRVIEVERLDNLLPGRVPPDLEDYLNERLIKELRSVVSSPTVVPLDGPSGQGGKEKTAPAPGTLLCEGVIDDYDPGYFALRLVELGFNHVALTVRLQLRDKESGRILGAVSVTSQDDRVTATSRAAVDRLAKRFGDFVNSGYAG